MNYNYNLKVNLLSEEDGGGYLIEVIELPGCIAAGDNLDEAFAKLDDAIGTWIEWAEEVGREIPQPNYYKEEVDYSGKFTLRMPKELHKKLDLAAQREGVSINMLVNYYLSTCVSSIFQEGDSTTRGKDGKEILSERAMQNINKG